MSGLGLTRSVLNRAYMNAATDLTSTKPSETVFIANPKKKRGDERESEIARDCKRTNEEGRQDDQYAYHVWRSDSQCTFAHRFQTPKASGSSQLAEVMWRSASALVATCLVEDTLLGSCVRTKPAQQPERRRGCYHGRPVSCFSKEASGGPGPRQ